MTTEPPDQHDMGLAERRRLRESRLSKQSVDKPLSNGSPVAASSSNDGDSRIIAALANDEDKLVHIMAMISKLYEKTLDKEAPFMTFVIVGMQSTGKSTIMERFLNAPLNIVQEGTGTRCPLDTTCIHDSSCPEPVCELYGEELHSSENRQGLSVSDVFASVVAHNKFLGKEDRFSTKPIRLHIRASNVQNMRFVDTPGIIENRSTGKDNREDIKSILVSEMLKANTKLCVLVEPKEHATNAIFRICDEALGGTGDWKRSSTFLMTKFDKQLEDSRSGSKANHFFAEYIANGCVPFLVMTPTLPKENLDTDVLFKKRRKLLASADTYERQKFKEWNELHAYFRSMNQDEDLHPDVASKQGFSLAKAEMKKVMIADTVRRLPDVIASIRAELGSRRKELAFYEEKKRMADPKELKLAASGMIHALRSQVVAYLDGDLQSTLRFQNRLQNLFDEMEAEDVSDWAMEELNFCSENEVMWRKQIARASEAGLPAELLANERFLGGKQVQRAIKFFNYAVLDSLPDPFDLKEHVVNATGYMAGGLNHENWERAMVQITTGLMKDLSHPGFNYVIKHVGCILRRLFHIAMDDIKQGKEMSAKYKLVPLAVETHLQKVYESMLWGLMKTTAGRVHFAVEPLYSTVNPNLPNYYPSSHLAGNTVQNYQVNSQGKFFAVESEKDKANASWKDQLECRVAALAESTDKAKEFLKSEFQKRASMKKSFMPSDRATMTTGEEADLILRSSFVYLVALQEFIFVSFEFNLNHYLYEAFKNELSTSFVQAGEDADWAALVALDPSVQQTIDRLTVQIAGLTASLDEFQSLSRAV